MSAAAGKKDSDFQAFVKTLAGATDKTFKSMCSLVIDDAPKIRKFFIVECDGKMRVSGMEKFNGPAYISTISFYRSAEDTKKHKACGAIVLYIEQTEAERLLKSLGYRDANEEDQDSMMKPCGEFCKIIAGNFKNELVTEGNVDLVMSSPENYHNSVPLGVDFGYDQVEQYELRFAIRGKEIMAVDITLSPASR
jgi:hypothetical protein